MLVLLFGATGQLGRELRMELPRMGRVMCASRSGVLDDGSACERSDLSEPGSALALVRRVRPDVVVNAAGYTAVDDAESHRAGAFRLNADAVGEMARGCADVGAILVHYSSDYVFSGGGVRPWREGDLASPINVYGASKLAGELAVVESGCGHRIFRTSWLYGSHGNNFLLTMLRLAQRVTELRVVDDQVGAPTPFGWIARATREALQSPRRDSGTWHVAATGHTTWFAFADAIFDRARALGILATTPRVRPVDSAGYRSVAARPLNSRLDCTRLAQDFGIALPPWEQGLDEVLAAIVAESAR